MRYMRINLKADIRRRTAAVITVVFFCILLAGGCAAAVFLKRPAVSVLENRDLEKFPEFSPKSYFDGSFTEQLDRYFTDTVPFRDILSECAAVLESAKGISAPQFYGVEVVNEDTSGETVTASETSGNNAAVSETKPYAPVSDESQSELTTSGEKTSASESVTVTSEAASTEAANSSEEFVGDIGDFLNNGILVNGVDMYGEKAGIMLFGGNDKQGKRYAELINHCKKELGDGVNVYNLIVPTSVEFYLPSKYSKYSNSEKDEIDFIYSCLDSSVIPVDAYSVLAEHKDEYIYFRTDHHWTDLGAYYAYTAFCGALGQTPPALDEYTAITKNEPYVGSLFGYTGDITLKNNPDIFTYHKTKSYFEGESFYYNTLRSAGVNPIYHEYASGSNMYGMYLGSDSMHIKIKTNAGTGRKIVMFKESYGNAFAPYLIDSFDEIYVIDIRYFGRNVIDYIKETGATDVLFLNNVFAANTSILIDSIERMMSSPTGTIVTAPPETVSSVQTGETVTSETGAQQTTALTQDTAKPETKLSETVPSVTTSAVTVPPNTDQGAEEIFPETVS